jgi:exodeoxyribonuclease-3
MDFLLASQQLLPRVTGDGVDREYRGRERPSDHTPVWMELAWP